MKVQLYGITNCDTVRKARAWLADQGIAVDFHDLRKTGVPADRLEAWIAAVGWERLLNRQGNTWRRLDDATRAAAGDADGARALMRSQPSVIKRPVVEWPAAAGGTLTTVGFAPAQWPPAGVRPPG